MSRTSPKVSSTASSWTDAYGQVVLLMKEEAAGVAPIDDFVEGVGVEGIEIGDEVVVGGTTIEHQRP